MSNIGHEGREVENKLQIIEPYDDVEEEGDSDESPHKLPKQKSQKKRKVTKKSSKIPTEHSRRQDKFS